MCKFSLTDNIQIIVLVTLKQYVKSDMCPPGEAQYKLGNAAVQWAWSK